MSQADIRNDTHPYSQNDTLATSFEERVAKMFGKEAGIIYPTCTMANNGALIIHTHPGSEVIIASSSHAI